MSPTKADLLKAIRQDTLSSRALEIDSSRRPATAAASERVVHSSPVTKSSPDPSRKLSHPQVPFPSRPGPARQGTSGHSDPVQLALAASRRTQSARVPHKSERSVSFGNATSEPEANAHQLSKLGSRASPLLASAKHGFVGSSSLSPVSGSAPKPPTPISPIKDSKATGWQSDDSTSPVRPARSIPSAKHLVVTTSHLPKALVGKIHEYRSDPSKKEQLEQRVSRYIQERADSSRLVHPTAVNFIETNKLAHSPIPSLSPTSTRCVSPRVSSPFNSAHFGTLDARSQDGTDGQFNSTFLTDMGSIRLGSASPEAMLKKALVWTGRPASGGSPTKRSEFVSERAFRIQEKAAHEEEVRMRHSTSVFERMESLQASANRWERRQAEEAARKEAEALAALQQQRSAMLAATCMLCKKLKAMHSLLLEDRAERPIRLKRKQAAVRIATWYKSVLLRRKGRALVGLMLQLRRCIVPKLPQIQHRVRERAAERVFAFLEFSDNANSAILAVRRFKELIIFVQRQWRSVREIREMQTNLLLRWFHKFEKSVLKDNRNAQVRKHRRPSDFEPSRPASPKGRRHDAPAVMPESALKRAGGSPQRPKSPLSRGVDIQDPELDAELAALMRPLPQDIRVRVVEETLMQERRKFHLVLEKYHAEMTIYHAQKPIDDVRMQLLRDAGLRPTPNVHPPPMPRITVLMPRVRLKEMLRKGMSYYQARLEEEERAREYAEEMDKALYGAPTPGIRGRR